MTTGYQKASPIRLLIASILVCFLAAASPGLAKNVTVTLKPESPAKTKLQTRFYKGLSEKAIVPFCVTAFEQDGYTVTLVSKELALVRAWQEEEITGSKQNEFRYRSFLREHGLCLLAP